MSRIGKQPIPLPAGVTLSPATSIVLDRARATNAALATWVGQNTVKHRVSGHALVCDVDEVSQTAANIEQTCRIVGYDRKIFKDGIFITRKGE